MDKLFLNAYKESCNNFKIAMEGLEKSYNHCVAIGEKQNYSFEETEAFDALIIKLSRNIDVFFQQIIKGFFKLKAEENLFFIDKVNLLEKMGIIENADIVLELKSFRNQAVHEYSVINFQLLYSEAVNNTKELIKIEQAFFDYLESNLS